MNHAVSFLIFYFILFSIACNGQNDTTSSSLDALYKEGQAKSTQIEDNYYSPRHRKIKNDSLRTVSKVALYLSAGGGMSNTYAIGGGAIKLSTIIAYKSHLFTATQMFGGNFFYGGRDGGQVQQTSSSGLLFGEAIRRKTSLLSASIGFAIYSAYANTNVVASQPENKSYDKDFVAAIPIELNYYYLSTSGIGLGFFVSESINLDAPQFSAFYCGASVVLGFWNNPRRIKSSIWHQFAEAFNQVHHFE
jgi:hypothetical protein